MFLGTSHSSDTATRPAEGFTPAKDIAAVLVPAAPDVLTPIAKSETSDQAVPFHNSVFAKLTSVLVYPPIHKADVLLAPTPIKLSLTVFKLLTSVHEVPFHVSVFDVRGDAKPPYAKADVYVPDPASEYLAVFKSATSVQPDQFQVSVFPVDEAPPKANAAVLDAPAPAKEFLPVFKFATSVQLLPAQVSVLTDLAVPV